MCCTREKYSDTYVKTPHTVEKTRASPNMNPIIANCERVLTNVGLMVSRKEELKRRFTLRGLENITA